MVQLIENFLKNKEVKEIIEDIRTSIKKVANICEQYNNLSLGSINADNFTEDKIYQILEKLKNSSEYDNSSDDNEDSSEYDEFSKKKEITVSVNKLEANIIIICFYYFFKEKKNLPPISLNNKKIIEYFTIENMLSQNDNGETHVKKDLTINNLENEINNLKTFYDKYIKRYFSNNIKKDNKNYNKEIKKEINNLFKTIIQMHHLYFPIFGMSNVGKSIMLNELIGYDLLPISEGKTTKRGILIKYWDKNYPEINKVAFKHNFDGYFFEHEAFLGKGINNVKKILESVNKEYTDNEKYFFYKIYRKIRYFEECQFPLKLKERICFIDLPGYGTNYKFEESEINSHLLKFCELVVFIFQIIKKETNKKILNKIIDEIKEKIRDKGTKTEVALQYRFMFIHNTEIQNESNNTEKNDKENDNKIFKLELEQSKKEIVELCGNSFSETNIGILNCKNYHNYLENLNKFLEKKNFLGTEKDNYERSTEIFYRGKLSAKGLKNTFSGYLKDILKDELEKARTLSYLSEEEIIKRVNDVDKNIYDNISDIVKIYVEKEISADRLKKIVNSIIQIIILNKNSKFLKNSNYDDFSKDLVKFIIFGEISKNRDLITDTDSLFEKLNNIFIKPSTDKKYDLKVLSTKVPELKNNSIKFQNDTDTLLKRMEIDLIKNPKNQENIIVFSLKKSLDDLKQSLNIEKNSIKSPDVNTDAKSMYEFKISIFSLFAFNLDWIVSGNWKKIEAKFREEFEKRTNNFKETFITEVNNFENIVKNSYEKIKKIFEDNLQILNEYFDKEELKKKFDLDIQDFKISLKFALDKFNEKKTFENVINDIIYEITEGSKKCISYNNCDSFLEYLKLNFSNSEYFFKIIDYMKEKSSEKFSKFIYDIEESSNEYFNYFINKFKNLENNLDKFYQDLINKEDEKYQKEKAEWEKYCNEYEELRDKILRYIKKVKNNINEYSLVIKNLGIKNSNFFLIENVNNETKYSSNEYDNFISRKVLNTQTFDFKIYILFVVIILCYILLKIYF